MAEDRMELFIETLTGAAFELKVSPFETIVSIKAKIQYLEGIPVSQQHLIWRSQELLDDYCLQDYCITDGATLKLVLGMRGGPINTRQAPADSKKLKDLTDFVEKRNETAASGGRPFTVLVFHDGDKVHMYTLLERGECSVTPLSGSISETSSISSTKNVEEDEAEDEEWVKENELTREKMIKIQEQIKAMNLNKPKRKVRPSSPATATTSVSSTKAKSIERNVTSGQQLRLPPLYSSISITPNITKPYRRISRTSSVNIDKMLAITEKNVCFQSTSSIENDLTFPSAFISKELKDFDSQENEKTRNVNIGDGDGSDNVPGASRSLITEDNSISSPLLTPSEEFLDVSQIPVSASISEQSEAIAQDTVSKTETTPLLPYLKPEQLQSVPAVDKKSFFNFPAQNASLIALGVSSQYSILGYRSHKPKKPHRNLSVTSNEALATQRFLDLDHWIDNRPKTTPQGNLYRPLDSIVEGGVLGPISGMHSERPKRKGKSKHPLSVSLPAESKLNPLIHCLPDNQDVRWNLKSSMYKNKNHSRHQTKLGVVTSLSGTKVLKTSPKPAELSENADSPPHTPSNKAKGGKDGGKPNSGQKLPPIKTKKKSYKRCSWCNKRTGLATSYTCRCNKNFCASHRYAELHHCSFDYKTEGRRFLQQSNPVVTAPKLPKI